VAVVDVKTRMVGGCTLVLFTTPFSSKNKIVGSLVLGMGKWAYLAKLQLLVFALCSCLFT